MSEINTHITTKKPEKKTGFILVLGWVFGILFLFTGFTLLFTKTLSGIFDILAGLSIFPPFWKIVSNKWNYNVRRRYKIILLIALLFVSGLVSEQNQTKSTDSNSATPTIQNTTKQPTSTEAPTETPILTPKASLTSIPKKSPMPTGSTTYHPPAPYINGYQNLNKVLINASITTNSEGILFTNNEKQQWDNCIATINPDAGSSNWYEYDFGSIPAGQTYTVGWSQLTQQDGTVYSNASHEAKIIQISCELDADTIGFARLKY